MLRKKDGFTLMELLVTILVSTLVTAAAATTILFGLRLNNQSAQTQTQQSTTRILLAVLEDMASEGNIGHVVSNYETWEIRGEVPEGVENAEGQLMLRYENGAILSAGDEVLMDGILASDVVYDGAQKLLTVAVETETGVFSSSIHCRVGEVKESGEAAVLDELEGKVDSELDKLAQTKEARNKLLQILAQQHKSKGLVMPSNPNNRLYYTQWYITTKEGTEAWGKDNWNENTPWCTAFISWGLAQIPPGYLMVPEGRGTAEGKPFWYANVDEFMDYFESVEEDGCWYETPVDPEAYWPNPGDVIFFDNLRQSEDEPNPDHVGIVYHVETHGTEERSDDSIFTIEGNSMGRVAIREYSATNPTIIGYGVLPWIAQETADGEGT